MQWFASASGKRGRSPKFADAAIQFCLTIKNLLGLALRQSQGFIESLFKLSGLHWLVPDFSTVCRRQRHLRVHVSYRSSQAGLHLFVDSTGIKFLGEGEWKCKKHGPERRRQWHKLHISMDAQTLQIRAICVTRNELSDGSVIADLQEQVPRNEAVLSLYAKAQPLRTVMRLSPHAGVWTEGYEKCGALITDAASWRPRCTASNDWASGSCLEPSSARSTSCTSAPPFSIDSPNWADLRRTSLHNFVCGKGELNLNRIYTTAPIRFERRLEMHLAFLKLATALICSRFVKRLR